MTTKHHTLAKAGGKSAASVTSMNIVELSQLSEKVIASSTGFLQKVMKLRHDSTAELKENAENVRD